MSSESDTSFEGSVKALEELLEEEAIYHVLGQFLVAPDGETTVADSLQRIATELHDIKNIMKAFLNKANANKG